MFFYELNKTDEDDLVIRREILYFPIYQSVAFARLSVFVVASQYRSSLGLPLLRVQIFNYSSHILSSYVLAHQLHRLQLHILAHQFALPSEL